MPTPSIVQTGSFATATHDIGRGAPVVMLHGSGPGVSGWENWQRTIPALSDDFRVIVPDLAGFGASRPPKDYAYSVAHWADQVVALLDALGIPRASVVGNSMGGRIAQRLAVVHPQRVARLVLIGAASPRPFQSAALSTTRNYKPTRQWMREMLKECLVHNPDAITDDLVEARFVMSTSPGLQEQFEAMFAGAGVVTDNVVSFDALANIQHGTLIIHGREDKVVPADHGWDLVRAIPNAELHVLPKCGHWTQMEASERCNELVRRHLLRG